MIVEAIRLFTTLAFTAIGFQIGGFAAGRVTGVPPDTPPVLGAVLGAGVGYVLGGVAGRAFRRRLETVPEKLATGLTGPELFAGAFGLMLGLVAGSIAGVPLVVLLPATVGWSLAALAVLLAALLGARIFVARSHDLLTVAGLRPRRLIVSRRLDSEERSYLHDSAAASDGRVLELARRGFIEGRVLVPAFVIDELQGMADSAETTRRRRGRRGLDIIDALHGHSDVEVIEDTLPEFEEVDAKLLELTVRSEGRLITIDQNLSRASQLRGVQVLDPSILGEALKPIFQVGEHLSVTIAREGTEADQGVAFLDDGTMVVVAGAAESVGSDLEVVITSSTKTAIGRMYFAKLS